MKVFISWSKAKSKEFALIMKEFLEMFNPSIEAFVSEVDIIGGEDVQEKIIRNINECDILALCFTKENKNSPWLLFEAGFARGVKKIVVPIIFDNDPNWHSWIDNPMNIARELTFSREDFMVSLFKCFSIENSKANKILFGEFTKTILEIKEKFREIDIHCEDLVDKLLSNPSFKLNNPIIKNKEVSFLTGFESFDLYKEIAESFLYTGKYLWIYGRRNTKLFGGNFRELFNYLKNKSYEKPLHNYGIDFRCLFLDPDSQETDSAHIHQDIFKQDLIVTINKARHEIGHNRNFMKCFKLYSNKRDEIIIRLDNTIIYSLPSYDAFGRPQLLTDTAFEVFSAQSERGKKCIEKFQNVWENAIDMT